MKKLDLRKELKHLYLPSAKKVQLVDVPRLKFVMIDGKIEPGEAPGTSPAFQENMMALYGASYTLKFMSKLRAEDPIDYPVMTLEGLWGLQDVEFDIRRKDNWSYTLMIMKPDHITQTMLEEAVEQVRAKRGENPALARLRLEEFEEGLCVQIMHIGPYDTEPETVDRMHDFARENGYTLHHNHHEIYIGNPLRAKPEKLKTVLRHPVTKL
jgi:hypothetical protein